MHCGSQFFNGVDSDAGNIGSHIFRDGSRDSSYEFLTILDGRSFGRFRCSLNRGGCLYLRTFDPDKRCADRSHDLTDDDQADQADENDAETKADDEEVGQLCA